jgi:sialate O-acetylesterase
MTLHIFNDCLLLSCCLFLAQGCFSTDKMSVRHFALPSLPPANGMNCQAGLAAPFAGIHNNVLLLAGGSNFSEKPLSEGGEKQYHDEVYVLHNYLQPCAKWETLSVKFPYKVAHGVSISTPEGILCIGGKNADRHFSKVWLMQWNEERQTACFEELPDLPYANADMSGALCGDRIYLAGGAVNGMAGNSCIYLDRPYSTAIGWKHLPSFPGKARLQPVAAAQYDGHEMCFYLFGGYYFDATQNVAPEIMTDSYKFIPSQNKWVSASGIIIDNETRAMIGASAVPANTGKIIFTGGVDKEVFFYDQDITRQIQQAKSAQNDSLSAALTHQRLQYWLQPPAFFRFNRDVVIYHSVTDTWEKAGTLPCQGFAGAAVVKSDDYFIVLNGEIKPGIRTNEVHAFEVIKTTKTNKGDRHAK